MNISNEFIQYIKISLKQILIFSFLLFKCLQTLICKKGTKIGMDSDLNCPLCQQQFHDQNPPRLLTNCGHTFCEKCLKKIMTQKKGSYKLVCPEDGEMVSLKNNSMNNFPKNIALLKILESKKNPIENLEVSKIVKTQQAQQDDDTSDIVASIISPNNTTSQENIKAQMKDEKQQQPKQKQQKLPQKQAKPQVEICLLHQKPLQVVCVIDLKKICASCAIFGEHRGHDFKSIDQIQKQRQAYYHAILNIMQKKDSLSQRISSQQTCSSIMEILEKKKENMKKSISQKYTKLISAIEAKQKQSMKSLQGVIVKTQSKLKNLMKIDPLVLQKYDKWEQKSYKQIKILEGDDFESKLQLLFVGAPNEVDVLEEGDNIIELMYKQQQNLISEVELALENIGVDFNMEVFNHIDNFVEVFDESKKKKTKGRSANKTDGLTSIANISPSPRTSITNSFPTTHNKKKDDANTLQVQPQTKQTQINKIVQQKVVQSPVSQGHHQESLLQMLEQLEVKKIQDPQKQIIPSLPKKEQEMLSSSLKQTPQKNISIQLNLSQSEGKGQKTSSKKKQLQNSKSPQLTERSNPKDSSFVQQKIQRPNKKKLARIKVGEKYQKMLNGLANDQLQTVDFTNAQLGDATIIQICQYLKGSKARTVKLISNKLNDDAIAKIMPFMDGVITLNLSQNFLTERVLDILYEGKVHLHSIKSIILSQNKIIERKSKAKIEKLKSLDITVSV